MTAVVIGLATSSIALPIGVVVGWLLRGAFIAWRRPPVIPGQRWWVPGVGEVRVYRVDSELPFVTDVYYVPTTHAIGARAGLGAFYRSGAHMLAAEHGSAS